MTEAERGDEATLFPQTVGERLRASREALGLSLADVAARTRIPLRHLDAIETSNFAGLPSATYAVGFVRAYARAVGADEVALARDTRAEVANTVRAKPRYEPYEVADPARVPPRGVTIVAAGLALAVLILGILWFTTGVFRRDGGATSDSPPPVIAPVPEVAEPAVPPTPAAGGRVTLTATDEVWIRVYDADDRTFYIGTMKPGDTFEVPAEAKDPMINVGRPDKLTVTLNGSAVAPLGTGERAIKDVRIGADALATRSSNAGAPNAAPTAGPPATPSATPRPPAAAAPSPTPRRTSRAPRPRATPSREGPENLLPSGFATGAPSP